MNKVEKVTFVKEVADTVLLEVIMNINSERIPQRWGPTELRAYLADKFMAAYDRFPIRGKQAGSYENDKIVNNL
jgi:hypothetical protein